MDDRVFVWDYQPIQEKIKERASEVCLSPRPSQELYHALFINLTVKCVVDSLPPRAMNPHGGRQLYETKSFKEFPEETLEEFSDIISDDFKKLIYSNKVSVDKFDFIRYQVGKGIVVIELGDKYE